MWQRLVDYWHIVTAAIAAIDIVLVIAVIPWVLSVKKEATSAIAWCLLVILLPVIGIVLFFLFGYQNVNRPLSRKRAHRVRYRAGTSSRPVESRTGQHEVDPGYEGLGKLAADFNASLPVDGNSVEFFHDGRGAFEAIFASVERARHHVHVQFFIFRNDRLGKRFLELLARKAKQGVEVRLLTDGIGARKFGRRATASLMKCGGKCSTFLPVSLWRRRLQINLRNHRKIVVVDGATGFTGGLNVGDEYVGEVPRFGYWRDTFVKLQGPVVDALQRVFVEDWDFASGENLKGVEYFPTNKAIGNVTAQIIASGPDQDLWSIREIYFAAILRSRKRLWVTSPYYVPDQAIRDGLCLAARLGVDVRLLLPQFPDHLMTYFAGRYYLPDLLAAGVKVFLYAKGFIHAKVIIVDGKWASVGTANLDNRSLLLNFEVNCLIHTASAVAELEAAFLHDLDESYRLDARTFAKRGLRGRILENVFRLFAPVL